MTTDEILARILLELSGARRTCQKYSAMITAGTFTNSHLLSGIQFNGVDRRRADIRMFWDLSNPAIDLTTQDYEVPNSRKAGWKHDTTTLATLQLTSTRNRQALIDAWRLALGNPTIDLDAAILAVVVAVNAVRSHINSNMGKNSPGQGGWLHMMKLDADGYPEWPVTTDWTALAPLLDNLAAAIDPLVP